MINFKPLFDVMIDDAKTFTVKNVTNHEKSLEDKKLEQNSIIPPNEHSFEADEENDDESSFADAAESKPDESEEPDQEDDDSSDTPDEPSDNEDGGDGDFGGDDDFDSDGDDFGGDGDEEGDGEGGGDEKSEGMNALDKYKGSSLNPFTQVNQKTFYVDKLNSLYDSINLTIDQYNTLYSDRYEIDQLRELAKIVDEERISFIMQQNPENYIQLRLFYERYEEIVNKFVENIKE